MSIRDLIKALFAKKIFWIVDLFIIRSIREVDKYINVGHRSNTRVIDKISNYKKDFFYLKLLK